METLIICGSIRPGSYTKAGLQTVATILAGKGASVRLWDLKETPLPIADPGYHRNPEEHPDPAVRELVEVATRAQVIVIGSPVYHNSYSGVLKNCLDWLTIKQFAYKSVGLLSHGSTHTAVQVCDHLRIVVRGLYGIAVPTQVVTVPQDFSRTDSGEYHISNPDIRKRMENLSNELIRFSTVKRTA